MRTLTLRNRFQGNATSVENDFIDNYMTKANGEYVKVYLLLLRHLNAVNSKLSVSCLADCLECTEKDILRAFKHWSKVGLLKIDYDETGVICGLSIGATTEPAEEAPAKKPSEQLDKNLTDKEVPQEEPPKKRAAKANSAKSQDKLRQLYFVAEQYMGKTLSVTDIKKINYFYDELGFSVDLIEYLIEYCVENNHKSMHYIESVALNWSDKGITTVAEAKEQSSLYNKSYFAVLKAFGISGRNPAPCEIKYIQKWMNDYGFTMDIILEACNRTISNIAKADFKYADSILTKWVSKQVHHFSDIAKADLAYQQEKTTRKSSSAKPSPASKNRFNNFESRTYDFQLLERQLLEQQMKEMHRDIK